MDDVGGFNPLFSETSIWCMGPDLHLGSLDPDSGFFKPAGSTEAMTKEAGLAFKNWRFPEENFTNKQKSNGKTLTRCLGYIGDEILPSDMEIMMNKYNKYNKRHGFSSKSVGKTSRFQTPHVQYLWEDWFLLGFVLLVISLRMVPW